MSNDLLKLGSYAELLLEDNKSLRKFMELKNAETLRILERMHDKNTKNIDSLKSENQHLNEEINKLVLERAQKNGENKSVDFVMDNKNNDESGIVESLTRVTQELEIEKRKVQYLGEQKAILEPSFYGLQQKNKELIEKKSFLESKLNELKSTNEDLAIRLRQSDIENTKINIEKRENEILNSKIVNGLENKIRELEQAILLIESRNKKNEIYQKE